MIVIYVVDAADRSEGLVGQPITALIQASDQAELTKRLSATSRAGPHPRSRWGLVYASGALRSLV